MGKKVIFSAIALIGMTIASYGVNHVKVKELKKEVAPLKTCKYTIKKNGKVVRTIYVTDVPDGDDCSSYSGVILQMHLDGKI